MINYENVVMKQVFKYKKHINIKLEKLSKNKKNIVYMIQECQNELMTHAHMYVCFQLSSLKRNGNNDLIAMNITIHRFQPLNVIPTNMNEDSMQKQLILFVGQKIQKCFVILEQKETAKENRSCQEDIIAIMYFLPVANYGTILIINTCNHQKKKLSY